MEAKNYLVEEVSKNYNEALEYYISLEIGNKKDFDKSIKDNGNSFVSYYYKESYEDSDYQNSRGNVYYPSSI